MCAKKMCAFNVKNNMKFPNNRFDSFFEKLKIPIEKKEENEVKKILYFGQICIHSLPIRLKCIK